MEKSPNYKDGVFVNSLPEQQPKMWPALVEWIKGTENEYPKTPPPVDTRKAADYASAPASGLRHTWIGHSSQLIEIDGQRVLFDPLWSMRASPFSFVGPTRFHRTPMPLDQLPKVDAVVISHDHYDHLDRRTIQKLQQLQGKHLRYIVPLGVGSHLRYWGIPAGQVVELDWWQETRVGALKLVATPARHFSGRSVVMADRNKTLWAGWAIIGPRHRVFFSGDTSMFPGFAEIGRRLGPFDLTMIEVGAYNQLWADVHLGPEQAVEAHRMLRGKVMMPVHWGTFALAVHGWTEPIERVFAAAKAKNVTVFAPRPGQSFEPASLPAQDRWWPKLPWRTAEQDPVVSSGLGREVAAGPAPAALQAD